MSYLIGCAETCSAVLVDPELGQIHRCLALALFSRLPATANRVFAPLLAVPLWLLIRARR
jgi:hypothetical protein